MALAAGTRLGPYEILAPLGVGGMGEVYRARDTRLDRAVAIKILPKQFSSDPVRKQRFEREAKTVSQLNHPHICALYDVGNQDGADVFGIFATIAEFERELIRDRVRSGIASARAKGKRLGRPLATFDVAQAQRLRANGLSWRRISKELGVPLGTVHRTLTGLL